MEKLEDFTKDLFDLGYELKIIKNGSYSFSEFKKAFFKALDKKGCDYSIIKNRKKELIFKTMLSCSEIKDLFNEGRNDSEDFYFNISSMALLTLAKPIIAPVSLLYLHSNGSIYK